MHFQILSTTDLYHAIFYPPKECSHLIGGSITIKNMTGKIFNTYCLKKEFLIGIL